MEYLFNQEFEPQFVSWLASFSLDNLVCFLPRERCERKPIQKVGVVALSTAGHKIRLYKWVCCFRFQAVMCHIEASDYICWGEGVSPPTADTMSSKFKRNARISP